MNVDRARTGEYERGEPAPTAHPLVHRLHRELVARGMARAELERIAGLGKTTLQSWWSADGAIMLQNIEATLNALGLKIDAAPMEQKPMALFTPGFWHTYGGHRALVDRVEENGNLIGTVIMAGSENAGRFKCFWGWDGKRIPRGGTDPTDLVPGGQA